MASKAHFFSPNFWIVAKSQFENRGMAVEPSDHLWARLGSVCDGLPNHKRPEIFAISDLKYTDTGSSFVYLQNMIFLKQQNPHHCIPQMPDMKLSDLLAHLCCVHKRCMQQAGCSDFLRMLMVSLRTVNVRFGANTVFQALSGQPEINCISNEKILNLALTGA